MLKAGYCTVQFNAFLQHKTPTLTMKGGNEEIYASGTLAKSKMIVAMHPDVARLAYRFHRWHHYTDYRRFKRNKLIRKPEIRITEKINNYGMQLHQIKV